MSVTPEPSLNILWGVWYASWMIAVLWSARTKTQMKTDMRGAHRFASAIGAILLFCPHRLADWPPGGAVFRLVFGRMWNPSNLLAWIFFGLAVCGFAFCWWARLHLGKLWSGFVTLKDGHRIVDTGPYALVRHPIYSGVIFAAFATALIRGTPAAVAGAALIALGFSLTARIEEDFLRAQLGVGLYDDYRRRVGMLIPGVGGHASR